MSIQRKGKIHKPVKFKMLIEMFYLHSTLNFWIPSVLVFQFEVYYKVDRLQTGQLLNKKEQQIDGIQIKLVVEGNAFKKVMCQIYTTCFGKTPSSAFITTISITFPMALVKYLRASVMAFIETGAWKNKRSRN